MLQNWAKCVFLEVSLDPRSTPLERKPLDSRSRVLSSLERTTVIKLERRSSRSSRLLCFVRFLPSVPFSSFFSQIFSFNRVLSFRNHLQTKVNPFLFSFFMIWCISFGCFSECYAYGFRIGCLRVFFDCFPFILVC
ncbi:hypothetical protein I3843_14G133100 [Carya illinoinensis]|nr:hypothetical protein I3843_14G133100 [Carya illinoinensis]